MDAWNFVSAFLQLLTIYLIGQGGVTLSLIGFRPRDVNPAMENLRTLLNVVALFSLVIAICAIIVSLILAELFSRPHFEGPDTEKANKALFECLEIPNLGARTTPIDAEAAAWANITKYRECVQLTAPKFNVKVVYGHTMLEFFMKNARITAALFGLILVVPGIFYFSTRLKGLNVNENRPTLIVKACAEIYAGIILQLFLEVADRFGSFMLNR